MNKRIVESYKKKLETEEGVIVKRSASCESRFAIEHSRRRNGKSRFAYDV